MINRELFIWVLPFALLLTTFAAFHFLAKKFGQKSGYFLGFVFYWVVWCLLIPKIFLSGKEIKELFSFDLSSLKEKSFINLLCLIAPLILACGYALPKALHHATFKIILLSLILALVNAPLEELLWRGLYLKFFGDNQLLFILYSSFGFAIWHFAPQTIFPNKAPGGQWSFVAVAFILGVLYSIVVKNTNSILLTSASHFLFDFSGLGGRIYFRKS